MEEDNPRCLQSYSHFLRWEVGKESFLDKQPQSALIVTLMKFEVITVFPDSIGSHKQICPFQNCCSSHRMAEHKTYLCFWRELPLSISGYNKAVSFKLQCASASPKGLLKMLNPSSRVSDSILLSQTPQFAFPTTTQLMLMLLIWGPHFENHCFFQWVH